MGALLKNYFLLEFPDGVRELAIFALAWSIFMPLQSAMWMVPQAVNVLVVDRGSLRKSLQFFGGIVCLMTLPLFVIGFTPLGYDFLGTVYELDEEGLRRVQLYLRWFVSFPLLMTTGQFLQGMMVRAEATGKTTVIEVIRMLGMSLVLWYGVSRGNDPVATLIYAQIFADVLAIVLRGVSLWPLRGKWTAVGKVVPSFREIAAFFLPIAFTTLMFSFGRPIVFGFMTKIDASNLPEGTSMVAMIAGLNLAWSFVPLFVNPLNQIRSVFVNYAREDLKGVVVLLKRVMVIIVSVWLLVAWTGLAGMFFRGLQGADATTSAIGEVAFRTLIVLPLFMGWRNYYHGLSLTYKKTRSMGLAALCRVGTIYCTCWMFYELELLSAVTAAVSFGSGFVVETFVSILATRKMRREILGEG